MIPSRVSIVGCCLVAISVAGCGNSGPEGKVAGRPSGGTDRIVGRWTATDDSGVMLDFDRAGKLTLRTQGKALDDRGDYKFVDARRVEVTGKNFLITYNTKPLPMAFTADFDDDGRGITITPTAERASMMQFQLFGNGKFHTFPPEKKPERYTRAD